MIGTKVLRQHRVGDWLALLVVPPFSDQWRKVSRTASRMGEVLNGLPREHQRQRHPVL